MFIGLFIRRLYCFIKFQRKQMKKKKNSLLLLLMCFLSSLTLNLITIRLFQCPTLHSVIIYFEHFFLNIFFYKFFFAVCLLTMIIKKDTNFAHNFRLVRDCQKIFCLWKLKIQNLYWGFHSYGIPSVLLEMTEYVSV